MMANKREPVAVERDRVRQAFHAWASEHEATAYGELRKMSVGGESVFALVHDAIDEMVELRIPLFDDWWLRNHYRYTMMREIERRRVRAMAREFLSALCHGKVIV